MVPAPMPAADTRSAILDAAESLLAEQGYAAMSLRSVTQRAKANLAAVNYHFGGKEGLARAVLLRRIEPVNAERLRRLTAATATRQPRAPLPLRAVVAAFVGPAMEMVAAAGPVPCAMVGRMMAEQPPFLQPFLTEQFGAVLQRFAAALRAAQPGLPAAEAWWQLHFMIGAMAHTMLHRGLLADMGGPRAEAESLTEITERLCAFCTNGARAATTRRQPPSRRGPGAPARRPATNTPRR
jgi:AcrR family transcriptional regulator